MTLENKIALLNDNVGSLVSETNKLTSKVESKLTEYDDWINTIYKSSSVTLKVGSKEEFKHPVEAADHINKSKGDISWKIEIAAGVYEFPYNGIDAIKFSYNKYVQIIGASTNASDVIFKYVGDNHAYMIIAERNSYIDVRNISFKGTNLITNSLISQIRDRSLRSGMAGGGLAHGILCRFNSSAYIKNCDFNNLWHAIHCHDNCKIDIDNINGTQLYGGVHCTANSRIYIKRSFLRGTGPGPWNKSCWAAFAAFHCSSIFCYGVECRDFHVGLYCQWSSDFHFHQTYDYDNDGISKINIKNGHIENCHHALHIWHHSGGNAANLLVKNMQSHAIMCGCGSNIHANHNVTIDGADIGFYVVHDSAIVANHSTVRHCRNTAYYSAHKSELHAGGTRGRLVGNRIGYSPGRSHSLGNHDAYIYFS